MNTLEWNDETAQCNEKEPKSTGMSLMAQGSTINIKPLATASSQKALNISKGSVATNFT